MALKPAQSEPKPDQSVQARRDRLLFEYACPIHGNELSLGDQRFTDDPFGAYQIARCTAEACEFEAKAFGECGPYEVLAPLDVLIDLPSGPSLRPGEGFVRSPTQHDALLNGPLNGVKIWDTPDDQSTIAQRRRLGAGNCPIHDQVLLQTGGWYLDELGRRHTIVGCGRDCCPELARMYSSRGPWLRIDT